MAVTRRAPPLGELVSSIENHRKTVRVCNFTGTGAELAALREHFEPHDVEVVVAEDPGRPTDAVDLLSNGRREATSAATDLLAYVREWERAPSAGLSAEPPAVIDRLNDTYFESYGKKRMIMASRIVEFRALNNGSGEIHAGFQDLERIDFQRSTYRHLSETGLDVHVYGAAAPGTTRGLDLHVHEGTSKEFANYWWVAFDGDGDDEQTAVLLAEEREPNRFFGFWTYESGITDDVLARMPALQD